MKLKMVIEAPDGKKTTDRIDSRIAWTAARAVATQTHYGVTLFGQYGTAVFNYCGGGCVEWNEKSTAPGKAEKFGDSTTVCI